MAEDRLSALPEDLISCILSFLPMDSAIQTGTLSKRWLNSWKLMNIIYFRDSRAKMEYSFVDHCISLLEAEKINKFTVVGNFGSRSESSIHSWFDFAIAKQVESFELYVMLDSYSYFKLPDSFYVKSSSTESMGNMALSRADFTKSNTGLGLFPYPSLKKLFLFECWLHEEAIQVIMSTCMVLESLRIVRCEGYHYVAKFSSSFLKELVYVNGCEFDAREIEFDAPNLTILKVYNAVTQITKFSGCPSEIRLYDPEIYERLSENLLKNTKDVTSMLSDMKAFGTDMWPFLEFLMKYVIEKPHAKFKNLTEFHLASAVHVKAKVMILFTFLGECPSLEKIQIEFDNTISLARDGKLRIFTGNHEFFMPPPDWTSAFTNIDKEEEEDAILVLKGGILKRLRIIELFYCCGEIDEVMIIKPLLKKAPNLERVVLSYVAPEHHEIREFGQIPALHIIEQLKQEMSLLPRASPNAKFDILV